MSSTTATPTSTLPLQVGGGRRKHSISEILRQEPPHKQLDPFWYRTQPEEDETESHPQFARGNVTLVTTKDAWERKVLEAKAQGKI
ncbi:hypothetical protein Tco_1581470, partial [Tanacetum coccineum]